MYTWTDGTGPNATNQKGGHMNQKISQMIIAKVAQGATVKQAIDAVLGHGTFSKLASDLYDHLTAAKQGGAA